MSRCNSPGLHLRLYPKLSQQASWYVWQRWRGESMNYRIAHYGHRNGTVMMGLVEAGCRHAEIKEILSNGVDPLEMPPGGTIGG